MLLRQAHYKQHWVALKRILRYLKGTANYGLVYLESDKNLLIAYCDADWVGDTTDQKLICVYAGRCSDQLEEWQTNLRGYLYPRGRKYILCQQQSKRLCGYSNSQVISLG